MRDPWYPDCESGMLALDSAGNRIARVQCFEIPDRRDPDEASSPFEERFFDVFDSLSAIEHPCLPRILSRGRSGNRVFIASACPDGERLDHYLARMEGFPEVVASRLLRPLADLFSDIADPLPFVLRDLRSDRMGISGRSNDTLSLHFLDWSDWQKTSSANDPEPLSRQFVLLFARLRVGSAIGSEDEHTLLARARKGASPQEADWLNRWLDHRDDHSSQISDWLPDFLGSLRDLEEGITSSSDSSEPTHTNLPLPNPLLSHCFSQGLSSSTPSPSSSGGEKRSDCRERSFPQWSNLPPIVGIDQHRAALRRVGRPLPNQLAIERIENTETGLRILEESVEGGISLETLLCLSPPLNAATTSALFTRISAALDAIEAPASSASVWWLPARNIFLRFGDSSPKGIANLLEIQEGPSLLSRLPLRLRLHLCTDDLRAGISLPPGIQRIAMQGGKQGHSARRGAVLLPLMWRCLTGEAMPWDRPLVAPESASLSKSIVAQWESVRVQLMESPLSFTDPFPPLPISRSIPFERAVSTVSDPETLFVIGENTAAASAPSPLSPAEESLSNLGEIRPEPESDSLLPPLPSEKHAAPPRETPQRWLSPNVIASHASPPAIDQPAENLAAKEIVPDETPEPESSATPETNESEPTAPNEIEPVPESASPPEVVVHTESEAEANAESLSFFSFLTSESVPAEHSEARLNREETVSFRRYQTWPPVHRNELEWLLEHGRQVMDRGREMSQPVVSRLKKIKLPKREKKEKPPEPPPSEEQTRLDVPVVMSGRPQRAPRPLLPFIGLFCLLMVAWGTLHILKHGPPWQEPASPVDELPPVLLSDFAGTIDSQPLPPRESAPASEEISADQLNALTEQAKNDPAVSAALAEYYLPEDRERAIHWLRRSAASGNIDHQRKLGLLLAQRTDSLAEAASWLQRSADQGDRDAQFAFGAALIHGHGVYPDFLSAIDYLEKASLQGDARAMDLLGVCLAEGLGRPADPAGAFRHFHAAVQAGHRRSYYHLALCFARGQGTLLDPHAAAEVLQQGAERGDAACMHALGLCFQSGFGVDIDLTQSARWIKSAASLGHRDALEWCEREGHTVGVVVNE